MRFVQRHSHRVAVMFAIALVIAGVVGGPAVGSAQAPAPPPHARSPFVSIDTAVVALQHVTVINGTGAPAPAMRPW